MKDDPLRAAAKFVVDEGRGQRARRIRLFKWRPPVQTGPPIDAGRFSSPCAWRLPCSACIGRCEGSISSSWMTLFM